MDASSPFATVGFMKILLLIVFVIVISIISLIRNDMNIDELNEGIIATSNISYLTSFHVLIMRFIMLIIISWSCLYIYIDSKGLDISLYTRGTVHDINLKHSGRFAAFTVWCWALQGIYFGLSFFCSLNQSLIELNDRPLLQLPKIIIFIAYVVFEISFAMSFLVTIVVTFVLIPSGIKKGINNDGMFKFFPLLFHNANVLFMVLELLTNKLKFSLNHYPFVLLYGCSYCIFSWYFFSCRKVFMYFFLDYDGIFIIIIIIIFITLTLILKRHTLYLHI